MVPRPSIRPKMKYEYIYVSENYGYDSILLIFLNYSLLISDAYMTSLAVLKASISEGFLTNCYFI